MPYGRFVDARVIKARMQQKDHRMAREQEQRETPVTDYEMAAAMMTFGGSFVRLLGQAWNCADDVNRAKILATWPEYVAEYRDLARLRRVAT